MSGARGRDWPELSYRECAILCPARMAQVCMVNLYRELVRPGSTPAGAPVWYSRWLRYANQQASQGKVDERQLELPFTQE